MVWRGGGGNFIVDGDLAPVEIMTEVSSNPLWGCSYSSVAAAWLLVTQARAVSAALRTVGIVVGVLDVEGVVVLVGIGLLCWSLKAELRR